MKILISNLLVASFVFPATLFAQTAQNIDSGKVTQLAATSDQLAQKAGIKFVKPDGTETSLAQMVTSAVSLNEEFRAIIPANDKTQLKQSIGLRARYISEDESGFKMLIALSDDAFRKTISSQVIKYDFSKSADENTAVLGLTLKNMTQNISAQITAKKSQSFVAAIFNLILPKAAASDSILSNPILKFLLGVAYFVNGVVLFRVARRNQLTVKDDGYTRTVILVSSLIMFTEGVEKLAEANY